MGWWDGDTYCQTYSKGTNIQHSFSTFRTSLRDGDYRTNHVKKVWFCTITWERGTQLTEQL